MGTVAWTTWGTPGGFLGLAGEMGLGLVIVGLACAAMTMRVLSQRAQARAAEERRTVEADARSKRELLEVVMENLAEGVTVIDDRGTVLVQNPAAQAIVGVPTVERASEWQELYVAFRADGTTPFPTQDMPMVRALAGESSDNVRMLIRNEVRPDGVPIEVSARPYQTANGVSGSVGVFRDISERLAAQRIQEEREQLLSAVVETAPSAFVLLGVEGRVEWWNRGAERLFGWTSSEAVGRDLADLIVPEHLRAGHNAGLRRRADGGEPRLGADPVQVEAVHRDGRPLLVELSLGELAWEGGRKFHAFLQDVAEREGARQALLSSEERFRTSFANAPIGNLLTNLREPHWGRLLAANPAAQRLLGYSEEELRSMSFRDITHPDDVAQDVEMLHRLLDGDLQKLEYEKRYVRADGTPVWVSMSSIVVRDPDGAPIHTITQFLDITERRAQGQHLEMLHREMEHRALYDPLTGLANRGLLMDRLTGALGNDRHRNSVGVGFCDVDHFKAINDTHGHHVGDAVLREVARRLQASVRAHDMVARLGGDEFVILLRDVASPDEAAAVMDRAIASIKAPIVVDDVTVRTSISGGLAIAPVGGDPEAVLRDADAALYVAKNSGRGRVEAASPTTDGPTP